MRVETVAGVGVPPGEPTLSALPERWGDDVGHLARGRLAPGEIDTLGRALGAALLPGEQGEFAARAYERLRGQGHRVRLRLVCTDPVLAAVPWELALPTGGFDGLALWENPELSVTRLEPGQRAVEAEPLPGRLAVTLLEQRRVGGAYPDLPPLLAGAANEVGSSEIGPGWAGPADREGASGPAAPATGSVGALTRQLAGLVEVHGEVGAATTVDQVSASERPVLVLSGHGDHLDGEVRLLVRGWAGPEALGGDALAGAAVRGRPTVAVLVACRSGQRAAPPPPTPPAPAQPVDSGRWAGPAMALVRAGVPYVVAFQHEARFDTARAFLVALLVGLARGESVDAAVAQGRQAMRSAVEDPRWPQSWLPVLYAFDRDGAARPFTVSQRVEAERVGTVVGAEGDLMAARGGTVRSEVVAGNVEQVVAWRPGRTPER